MAESVSEAAETVNGGGGREGEAPSEPFFHGSLRDPRLARRLALPEGALSWDYIIREIG